MMDIHNVDAGLPIGDELALRLADLSEPGAAIDLVVRPAPSGQPVVIGVPVDGTRLAIGRRAEIDVDVALVSRRHAELWCADGRLLLADAGSRNGTWVRRDGELLAAAEPVEVFQGDVVVTVDDTNVLTIGPEP